MSDYSVKAKFSKANATTTNISCHLGIINIGEIPALTEQASNGSISPELLAISKERWRGDFTKKDAIWSLKETAKSSHSRISNAACLTGDLLSFYIEPEGHGVGIFNGEMVYSKTTLEITVYDAVRSDSNTITFTDFTSPKNDPSRFLVLKMPEEDDILSSQFFSEHGMSGLMTLRIREIIEMHRMADWSDTMPFSQSSPKFNDSFIQIAVYPWNLSLREFSFSPAEQNVSISNLSRFVTNTIDASDDAITVFDYRTYFPSYHHISNGQPVSLKYWEKEQVVRNNTIALISSQLPLLNASSYMSPVLGIGMSDTPGFKKDEESAIIRHRAWSETISDSKSAMSFSLTGVPPLINTLSGLNDFTSNHSQLSSVARNPLRTFLKNSNPDKSKISFSLLGQKPSGLYAHANVQNSENSVILNNKDKDVVVNLLLGDNSEQTNIRNVILFFGNGMGINHQNATSLYKTGQIEQLFWQKDFTASRILKTTSLDGITDSAAAATAISTGIQVKNGVISVKSPTDADPLKTLFEYAKEKGLKTGLVTTTISTDATMAAFGAHRTSRNDKNGIAYDFLNNSKPFLMLGKGDNGLTAIDAINAGYYVTTLKEEFQTITGKQLEQWDRKLSGQYQPSGSDSYVIDEPSASTMPSLPDMVSKAIELLSYNGNNFFLTIDGALIDHAAHNSLTMTMVEEILDLEKAVLAAWDWAKNRDDTLIMVLSDHETGGLNVNSLTLQGQTPDVSWTAPGSHTNRDVMAYTLGSHSAGLNNLVPTLYSDLHHVDINRFLLNNLTSISLNFQTTIPNEKIKSVSFSFSINDFDFYIYTDESGLLRNKTFDLKEYGLTLTNEDVVYGRIGIEDENGKVSYWYSELNLSIQNGKYSISDFRANMRRDGSGIIDAFYNLESPFELSSSQIRLYASFDNGLIWHLISPAGDVGAVLAGKNRHITWTPYVDYPAYIDKEVSLKIVSDNDICGRMTSGTIHIPKINSAYLSKYISNPISQGIYDGENIKNPFLHFRKYEIEIENSSSYSSESSLSSLSSSSNSSKSSPSSESSISSSASSVSSRSSTFYIGPCSAPCVLNVKFMTHIAPDKLIITSGGVTVLDTGYITTGMYVWNEYSVNITDCNIKICVDAPDYGTLWQLEVSGCGMNIATGGGEGYYCYGPYVDIGWNVTSANPCSAHPWVISNENKSIRYVVEDSLECGGTCGSIQSGTATATIDVGDSPTYLGVAVSGVVEKEDIGYELLDVKLNGTTIVTGQSPGGSPGTCDMGDPSLTWVSPSPYLLPANSTNTILISFTTNGAMYHQGAYYQIDLSY